MMGFTTAEVINISRGSNQIPLLTKETLEQIQPDQEETQQYLAQYQKAADELTKQNMFVPPPDESEPPADCTAIFGDEARIGNRWFKAGDQVGDAEVVAVGPTSVTLYWEDRIITRAPVLRLEDESNRRSSRSSSRDSSRDRSPRNSDRGMGRGMMGGGMMGGGMMGGGMGQMIRNFMDMPAEQRDQHMNMLGDQFQGVLEIRSSDSGQSGQNTQMLMNFRRDAIR